MKAKPAMQRAYATRYKIKEMGGVTKAAKKGNLDAIMMYLPKAPTLEETADEGATPAERMHTEDAAPKAKGRKAKVADPMNYDGVNSYKNYLTSIGKTLTVLVDQNSILTPEETEKVEADLAKIDKKLKGYLSNYVAQTKAEMEDAVAKLKEAQDKIKGLEELTK